MRRIVQVVWFLALALMVFVTIASCGKDRRNATTAPPTPRSSDGVTTSSQADGRDPPPPPRFGPVRGDGSVERPTISKHIGDDTTTKSHDLDGRVVRVWFATNRAPKDPNDPAKGFGSQRAIDDRLLLGSCVCFIPRSRPYGTLGSSWWDRVTSGRDDRITVDAIELDEETVYFRKMADRIAAASENERSILLYIHGYNNSFEGAARRAAQLAVDLNVPGLTAFYSWPSMGDPTEYSADEAAVESAERHLTSFLLDLSTRTGATRVNIIAHSMGNRLLARVMQRLRSMPELRDKPLRFGQIILAAPDMDFATFRELAAAYPLMSERTTLYVSAKDKALEASAWKHSFHRAGYTPPIAIIPDIDTVEVSAVDPSMLGHGYVAEAEPVLFDIAQLIRGGKPVAQRPHIAEQTTPEGQKFWVLR